MLIRKFLIAVTLFAFVITVVVPPVWAQELSLPQAQQMVSLSPAYAPCLLRGIKLDPKNPFRLDFIVDEGESGLNGAAFQDESQKLIKYFLASLTTPEKDVWVNLSPYENSRIIQDDFGRTAMGRDLLAEDYLLKQITSSLMHPDSDLGKKFWDEVYRRSYEKFGTTDIPVDTFNKVWIVPERAVIYENKDSGKNQGLAAFVDEARLKVMLESDYKAMQESTVNSQKSNKGQITNDTLTTDLLTIDHSEPQVLNPTQELSKQIIRDVIVPALEKEVNEGKNFASLRQVYHSLLLAVWLKKKLKTAVPLQDKESEDGKGLRSGNIFSLLFVNKHKTGGIETADPKSEIRNIYDRYVEAFQKGVYSLIREDYDFYSQEVIPRKYFSGGVTFGDAAQAVETRTAGMPGEWLIHAQAVSVNLEVVNETENVPGQLARLAFVIDGNDVVVEDSGIRTPLTSLSADGRTQRGVANEVAEDLLISLVGRLPDEMNDYENDVSSPLYDFMFFSEIVNGTGGFLYILGEIMANAFDSLRLKNDGKGRVQVTAGIVEGQYILEVEDNGTGLLIEKEKLFKYQGSAKIRIQEFRRGTGLFSSRLFLNYYGGSIEIFDHKKDFGREGSGVTVRVRLPVDIDINKPPFNFKEEVAKERVMKGSASLVRLIFGLDKEGVAIDDSVDSDSAMNASQVKKVFIAAMSLASFGTGAFFMMNPRMPEQQNRVVRSPMTVKSEVNAIAASITEAQNRKYILAKRSLPAAVTPQVIYSRLDVSPAEFSKAVTLSYQYCDNFQKVGLSAEDLVRFLGLGNKESTLFHDAVQKIWVKTKDGWVAKSGARGVFQFNDKETWGRYVKALEESMSRKTGKPVQLNWSWDKEVFEADKNFMVAMIKLNDDMKVATEKLNAVRELERKRYDAVVERIQEIRHPRAESLSEDKIILLVMLFEMHNRGTGYSAGNHLKKVEQVVGLVAMLSPDKDIVPYNAKKAALAAGLIKEVNIRVAMLPHGDKNVDNAMQPKDLGGIDLSTDNLNLLLKGNGGDLEFELTPQQIEMLQQNINGLVPVIINVQPVSNVPLFLGLSDKAENNS